MKFVEAVKKAYNEYNLKPAEHSYFGYDGDENNYKVWNGSACALGAAMVACDPTAPARWPQEVIAKGGGRLVTVEFIANTLGISYDEADYLNNIVPNINDSRTRRHLMDQYRRDNPEPLANRYKDYDLWNDLHIRWTKGFRDYVYDNKRFVNELLYRLSKSSARDTEVCDAKASQAG